MVTRRSIETTNTAKEQVLQSAKIAETLQPKANTATENKETQIVIRITESEKAEYKAYFAKHGLSMSKGLNIAFEVLRLLEKRGKVDLSKNGYSIAN